MPALSRIGAHLFRPSLVNGESGQRSLEGGVTAGLRVDGAILSDLLARRVSSRQIAGAGEVQIFDFVGRSGSTRLFIPPSGLSATDDPAAFVRSHVERSEGLVDNPVAVWTMAIARVPASLLVGELTLKAGRRREGVLAEFSPGGGAEPWPSPAVARALGRLLTRSSGDRVEVLRRIDDWCDEHDAHPALYLATHISDEPRLYRWFSDDAEVGIRVEPVRPGGSRAENAGRDRP